MINSVSNSLTGSNFAKRDYVVVDGKPYSVQRRPYHEPGVSTLAPVDRDVVVIKGKEYPVKEVSDMSACDKTKDVVVIDGKEYDVKPNLFIDTVLPPQKTPFIDTVLPPKIKSNNDSQPQKLYCVA